ncbi:MAG: DNA-processing protein DprA [Candidatus Marinimicrobia bacterium]|nr:DNA-processing protein DprA [Candidatus Neomarinimicrobiota bacterium]
MNYLGNKDLLKKHKIAFLCSRRYPPDVVLKAYDWAIEQREKGNCVISGFHSQIEKDVLHFLLKGKQPVIMVLARGMQKRFKRELIQAVKENRLSIVSPFKQTVMRATEKTAMIRNQLMVELADEVFIAYAAPDGNLDTHIRV